MYGHDEGKYRQKIMLKAEIIVGAANRLWGMRNREHDAAIGAGNTGCMANDRQESNSKWKLKLTSETHHILPKMNVNHVTNGRRRSKVT